MANDTAVITIDMQNDVLDRLLPEGAAAVWAIQNVLRASAVRERAGASRAASAPGGRVCCREVSTGRVRAATILCPRHAGGEVIDALEARPDEIRIAKPRFSSFFQTDLLLSCRGWASNAS